MMPRLTTALLSTLASILLCQRAEAQTCYLQNGTSIEGHLEKPGELVRCGDNSPAASNNCCVLAPDPNGLRPNSPDQCLPNGLCMYDSAIEPTGLQYYKTYCSDPNGEGCLKIDCPNPSGLGVQVTPCGSNWNATTKWCCGDSDACCLNDDDPNALHISRVLNENNRVAPSDTTSISSSSSTPSSVPSSSANQSSSLSPGTIAGIGIGAVLGSIAIFAMGFFLARRRLQQKNGERLPGGWSESDGFLATQHPKYGNPTAQHEAPGDYPVVQEMAQWRDPAELGLPTHK